MDLEDSDDSLLNKAVKSFRLERTSFDKKAYTTYMKGYLRKLKAAKGLTQEADVHTYDTEMAVEVKKVLADFTSFEFYVGESMNPDGAVMLLNYRADGTTPSSPSSSTPSRH